MITNTKTNEKRLINQLEHYGLVYDPCGVITRSIAEIVVNPLKLKSNNSRRSYPKINPENSIKLRQRQSFRTGVREYCAQQSLQSRLSLISRQYAWRAPLVPVTERLLIYKHEVITNNLLVLITGALSP